ncbi:hypothetical protein [Pseudodesulfovibrio sp. zrk46]|uniref:hypothetical protein n=1 Tax=Pseudodesulfovibrio sp. zrk46 TaxID=2725288 RepID=UPI001449836D|nr:hypothetical protein [Pseudodesulfovibrio sp. zrk46]QJB57021.1 hypothetical protein HFN16_11695 [Pseudodesulfovibrio sp. zrk46]
MINKLVCLAVSFLFVFACAVETFACDLYLPCESVEGIVVSKGTEHLSGGEKKMVFVACVDVDAAKTNLKELVAGCNHDSIVVKTGSTSITVPKSEFPGGHWFSIVRFEPQEALDAAMSLCPDKVKSYLP